MRFEVPQFIEIEDKVIGMLTWKQFAYLMGGLGAVLILYFTTPLLIFIPVGISVAGLSIALAFHKINSRPFSYYLESMFYYLIHARLYVWRRSHDVTIGPEALGERGVEHIVERQPAAAPRKNLQTIARELDLVALKGNQTQSEKWNETE